MHFSHTSKVFAVKIESENAVITHRIHDHATIFAYLVRDLRVSKLHGAESSEFEGRTLNVS
jgi:hypothetical protein